MSTFLNAFQGKDILGTRENKVFYKEDGKFIKCFDESFSLADILNEAFNQARVYELGIKVPKILAIQEINGYWAIVQEYIEGKTLSSIIEKANKKDKAKYLERFLDIQLEIFSFEAPLLNDLHVKMKRLIDNSEYNATIRYELHSRLSSMPKHKKVCHGDFNPSNIIITEDDEAYILDWSHVTSGNASADVALSYMQFMLAEEKEIAENYMNDFCEKSDTARQYVNQWIPIVACAQSTRNKPEEKDFLDSWVDVMEFQ